MIKLRASDKHYKNNLLVQFDQHITVPFTTYRLLIIVMERVTLSKNIPSASLYFPTPLQLADSSPLFWPVG